MTEHPFSCPVDGCGGGFGHGTFTDSGGVEHTRLESTCDHTLLPCEYCENAVRASRIVFTTPPDADVLEKTAKAILCEGCAKSNRVHALKRWKKDE